MEHRAQKEQVKGKKNWGGGVKRRATEGEGDESHRQTGFIILLSIPSRKF